MSDINNLSTEQLLEELKKRQVQEAMTIDEKIVEMTPKVNDSPNLNGLKTICSDYVREEIENGYTDDDLPHYIFEEALQAIMGKDVFDKLREIEKLKKQKNAR